MPESMQETPGAMRVDVVLSLSETRENDDITLTFGVSADQGNFHTTHVVKDYNPL